MAQIKRKQPQVVETENMVRVLMRVCDCVHDSHALAEELLTQIGRRVDEQIAFGQADQGRAPRPLIFGIAAAAYFAWAANRRDADARAGAEQDKLPADIGGQNV